MTIKKLYVFFFISCFCNVTAFNFFGSLLKNPIALNESIASVPKTGNAVNGLDIIFGAMNYF